VTQRALLSLAWLQQQYQLLLLLLLLLPLLPLLVAVASAASFQALDCSSPFKVPGPVVSRAT